MSGCSAKSKAEDGSGSLSGNEKYRTDVMKTVTGRKVDLTATDEEGRIRIYDESGMGLYYPASWDDYKYNDVVPVYSVFEQNAVLLQYIGEKYIDLNPSSIADKSEEEIIETIQKMVVPLFAVYRTEKNDNTVPEEYRSDYSFIEKLGIWHGYTYYFLYNTGLNDEKLKDKTSLKMI